MACLGVRRDEDLSNPAPSQQRSELHDDTPTSRMSSAVAAGLALTWIKGTNKAAPSDSAADQLKPAESWRVRWDAVHRKL